MSANATQLADGFPDLSGLPTARKLHWGRWLAVVAIVVVLGLIGRAFANATADLTVVDLSHPQLQPLADPRRGLIALANRADVAQVFVDGRLLVDGGWLVNGDERDICAAGAAAIERIWDLPEARAALPRSS